MEVEVEMFKFLDYIKGPTTSKNQADNKVLEIEMWK